MQNNNLSPAKRALLEKWLNGQFRDASTCISRRPAESPVPLSFPQRRLLFLELLHRGTAVNNLSVLLQFRGQLSIPVMEQSAAKIIRRHESLRTHFCFRNGLPTPEIAAAAGITIPVLDLQDTDRVEQLAKARQLAEKEVLQPFDLTKAPLIRLRFYMLRDETYLLLVMAHHTIADGWSLGIFLKELMHFYSEIRSGRSKQQPELPIQYADFAHWQTGAALEADLQTAIAYWKKQLGGELPVLELPADHPRGAKQTFAGGTHRFILSKQQTEALEKLSSESDSTLFMTLLTMYYILLHRYCEQDDIIIGTPVANRNRPELEKMIGVFINTLALRIKLSGNPGFRELLRQVRTICLGAYAHQDLPFEKLVDEMKPQRDLSRTPIFQVLFNFQNSPMPTLEMPGIETNFLEIDRGVSQFDLTLMITKLDGQCHVTVEYNHALFKAATIVGMFRSFQVLLEDVIAHPDAPVSNLPLLTGEEQHHLVSGLNQTQHYFPREICLHQLFEAQVEETPDAVAIIDDNQAITYSELNRRANVLARQLQAIGIAPENRVGICMEKSAELVVALFGVLKAGGTYIPIHPSLPEERARFMLRDAAVKLLLTNVDFQLPADDAIPVIRWNDYTSVNCDSTNLQPDITPDSLAYIIYTSGSTGQPKGVMVSHTALVNFLWSMRQRPGIKKEDVLLSVTSISFDIAALELFLPLVVGATVVIAGKETMSNPALLGQAIERYGISVMQATPATWQLLLDTGWVGKPDLKALCGGEALTRKLADQLLSRVGELWNMYGPTETTVWSSVAQIQKGDHPVTIGAPIANTQLYLLDANLHPVPRGVIGELYIGGEGLARGYLNNDQLTWEKFLPDPFSSRPGARVYKTGDRGRYLHDYSIELLGRIDDQVKIYGHRIELGEITAALLQHPAVQEAVTVTRTEADGGKRIVAYYVPSHGTSQNEDELQGFIRKKLPAYMLPVYIVRLDFLPLTPNGKIDRHSLPAPERIRQFSGYIAPRNTVEQILVSIWQDVLDVDIVGVEDNFFDLGGTSIQSLEIVAKTTMSGIPLTVENIFEYQTIAGLSAHLNVSS